MSSLANDLLAYIDASPTPYHAVAETARRLEAAGYDELAEGDAWSVEPGGRHYVTRSGGSIVAFQVGRAPLAQAGARVIGAHTDSPNLRVKPKPDRTGRGMHQIVMEPYGGVLLYTWLDRDLALAGRVVVRDGQGGQRTHRVRFDEPLLRVPSLAIHLDRNVNVEGLKLNAQQHMNPLIGLEGSAALVELLAQALTDEGASVSAEDVLAWDLMAYDLTPATRSGIDGAFIHAPRLDNLASCHAGLRALLGVESEADHTRVIAFWDHEEVGSSTASGAGSPFLADVLMRLAGDPVSFQQAVSRSALVSADMAHAVHPNHPEMHEPLHMPLLGAGPVIKTNTNQRYATDAETRALFLRCCEVVGAPVQHFVNRSDLACGSTIGPISATRLGIPTVDVGNPMLSMHSVREMCATDDVDPMTAAMRAFLGGVTL